MSWNLCPGGDIFLSIFEVVNVCLKTLASYIVFFFVRTCFNPIWYRLCYRRDWSRRKQKKRFLIQFNDATKALSGYICPTHFALAKNNRDKKAKNNWRCTISHCQRGKEELPKEQQKHREWLLEGDSAKLSLGFLWHLFEEEEEEKGGGMIKNTASPQRDQKKGGGLFICRNKGTIK